MNWDDAVAYCKWLSDKEKEIYRLPTEAEWEYACRAGTTTNYWFGASITTKQANFNMEIGGTTVAGVGKYPENSWKLQDMHGNVWEWCEDRYGNYPNQESSDPKGPSSGNSRVLRGGSFTGLASNVRSSSRFNYQPAYRYCIFGFRVARTFAA